MQTHSKSFPIQLTEKSTFNDIDWDCNFSTLYFEENVGCRNSIPNGLNWVFSEVEECIILEDDCLPDMSFFKYCSTLLEYYRNNEKIMSIGGHRYDGPDDFENNSYCFSKYPATWGWATWRRAWGKYDLQMKDWNDLRNTDWLEKILKNESYVKYWTYMFDKMCTGVDTWDYALTFSFWHENGISIRSNINLISNIGFNENATHTKHPNENIQLRLGKEIPFPLKHPDEIEIDDVYEDRIEWVSFSGITKRVIIEARNRILQKRANDSNQLDENKHQK